MRSSVVHHRDFLSWLGLPLAIFIVLPLAGLVGSHNWAALAEELGNPSVLSALRVSLLTTLAATIISVLLGLPLAWMLARHRTSWLRHAEVLVDLPLVLPPAVAGLGLLLAFGRNGILGDLLESMGLSIAFTPVAVVLAQVFVGAPLFVKAAVAGFRMVPLELEEAAAVSGAGPLRSFVSITLPMAGPALLAGTVACWARALGEFGATLLFAGSLPGKTQTLPLAIYQFMETNMESATTVSILLMVIALVVIVGVRLLWPGDRT